MRDLDPLLLRALKAGRAENPDEVQGKARALAALGLAADAPSPGATPPPTPSGLRLAPGARSMSRWPWWTLVFTAFVGGGAAWFHSDGAPASKEGSASAAVTTAATASPTSASSIGMSPSVDPELAPPSSVKTGESATPETKAPPAVVRPHGDGVAGISTRSVDELPNAREATVRSDAKLAAAPGPGKPVNTPCPGCDSPSSTSPERIADVGTATGAGASLREEIEALERASSALAQRHCADARRELAAYRSTFPNGKLGREADVVEIEITGRSGDIEGARTAARRFVERFPNSPYSLRLRPWLQPRDGDSASNIPLCVDATR